MLATSLLMFAGIVRRARARRRSRLSGRASGSGFISATLSLPSAGVKQASDRWKIGIAACRPNADTVKSIPSSVVAFPARRTFFYRRAGWGCRRKRYIDSMLSVIDGRWKGTILWRLLKKDTAPFALR